MVPLVRHDLLKISVLRRTVENKHKLTKNKDKTWGKQYNKTKIIMRDLSSI